MTRLIRTCSGLAGLLLMGACGPAGSAQTEKSGTGLADVPEGVMSAIRAAEPDFEPGEAETELRNGVRYYDVEGTLPGGAEIEFDVMAREGGWQVVEIQRDIGFDAMPETVRALFSQDGPDVAPARIIESRQTDGSIVFEIFTPGDDGTQVKTEILWADGEASLLEEEWQH